VKPIITLCKDAWNDYWQFWRKWWLPIFIASFLGTVCWMAVDAVLHPHPTMIVQGGK
jgi:ABC-type uncharacterized transport system permease subunit